ncbi:hypothetical protein BO94DRAFT_474325, partial [Aspergillus sclerotioniger CBS 115572]
HQKMANDEPEVHWFKLINNSGATQKYLMFAPPPTTDFDTPIWIVSNDIANETSWEVHTTAPIFAEIFNLAFNNGDPILQDSGEPSNDAVSFTVVTKDLPNDGNTYVIGFGKRNGPNGDITACASIPIHPNTQQVVNPIIELYFGNSSGTPGDLIDYNDLKGKPAHINFGVHTKDASLCTVIHNLDDLRSALALSNTRFSPAREVSSFKTS